MSNAAIRPRYSETTLSRFRRFALRALLATLASVLVVVVGGMQAKWVGATQADAVAITPSARTPDMAAATAPQDKSQRSGTTTLAVAFFTYDGPTIARVDVRASSSTVAGSAQVGDRRDVCAPPSMAVRGPSTTLLSLRTATNAVGGTHPLSAINPTAGTLNCVR
jgi:hypothetical protein